MARITPEAEMREAAERLQQGLGLALEHRPVAALVPYARNARTHSEAQVALIAGSIREFGFANPVLVDGANGVIAGHGRLLAAQKLGLATVPVIELAHLSEAQKRAYVLADNRLAERAGWDREMLALEAGDLAALGIEDCEETQPEGGTGEVELDPQAEPEEECKIDHDPIRDEAMAIMSDWIRLSGENETAGTERRRGRR